MFHIMWEVGVERENNVCLKPTHLTTLGLRARSMLLCFFVVVCHHGVVTIWERSSSSQYFLLQTSRHSFNMEFGLCVPLCIGLRSFLDGCPQSKNIRIILKQIEANWTLKSNPPLEPTFHNGCPICALFFELHFLVGPLVFPSQSDVV